MLLELAVVSDRDGARPAAGWAGWAEPRSRQPTEEEEAEAEDRDGRGQAQGVGPADVEGRHREEQGASEGDLQTVERLLPTQGRRK